MPVKLLGILLAAVCLCGIACGAQGGPQEAENSPFSGHVADAVWTVIAFVALVLVLGKFVWKPILTGLNARADHIEKQIADAEETRKEAGQVLAEYQSKLADVENEGKKIIAVRVKEAEAQSSQVIEKAKQEMEAMKLKVEADIERTRIQSQQELLVKSGEIIMELGREILGRTINDQDNQRLIEQAVARLKSEEEKQVN